MNNQNIQNITATSISQNSDLDSFISELEAEDQPQDNPVGSSKNTEKKNTEMADIQTIADDLMSLPLEQLDQKYSNHRLEELVTTLRPVTNTNVIDHLLLLRQLFITNFTTPENTNSIDNKTKEDIVFFIAHLEPASSPEIIANGLAKLNSTLILPSNFDFSSYQIQAQQLHNGVFNLKCIMAVNVGRTYFTDVMHLYQLSKEDIAELSEKVSNISAKLEVQYQHLEKNEEIDQTILTEAIDIINQTGRAPVTIQILRQNKNLGDVTDLILQLNTALQIVNILKAKSANRSLGEEEIIQGINNYIFDQITL